MSERAVWFGPTARPLFGLLGTPTGVGGGGRSHGVLLCPPIAGEARAAHAAFRRLAAQLNDAGLVTLRLDYDGTGESAGDNNDPDRAGAWVASVIAAADTLRAAGANWVGVVGMRLGATIAAAAEAAHFDAIVLWDPCLSGRSFVREQLALSAQVGTVPDTGAIDAPEFYFSQRTVADLVIGLPELSLPPHGPVLALLREDRPQKAIRRRLATVTPVEIVSAQGQDRLVDVPPEVAVIPVDSLHDVARWLVAQVTLATVTAVPLVARPTGPPARFRAEAGLTVAGTRLVEREVRLSPLGLFGIETRPVGPIVEETVVFLNVATERRLGPGRGWVTMARELAGSGLRSIRIDLSGVGDSPERPGQDRDKVYPPEWLSDTDAIVDALAPSPVVFVGLCSGGYSGIEAALRSSVRGVCAFNASLDNENLVPPAPGWFAERRALRAMPTQLRRFAVRHRRIAHAIWRAIRQVAIRRDPSDVLAKVVHRGTDLFLLSSPGDNQIHNDSLYWRWFGIPQLRRTGRFDARVLPAMDHSMYGHAGRCEALDVVTGHLSTTFGTGARSTRHDGPAVGRVSSTGGPGRARTAGHPEPVDAEETRA